ncbi:MAG: PGF-pre-PGF domain-containing protein [Candidatus Aenigmarchaeota archaeon]|nr:PGF-pre-PGF domain-containing protein [Candidatus Aenigmarchaeota archaeon]
MVDRPQTKLLLVFLTALVSLSVMSVSAFAMAQLNDSSFNISIDQSSLVSTANNSRTTGNYNASAVWVFSIQIFELNTSAQLTTKINLNDSISNVTWMFAHQNATAFTRNYTFGSGPGQNRTGGGTFNGTSAFNSTATARWTLNISQPLIGPAGNWNLTIVASNASDAAFGGACGSCINSSFFQFYIAPSPLNLTIRLNDTDANLNRTYEFGATAVVALLNITVSNTSSLNATGEKIFVYIDTNESGIWAISAGALTNISTATTNVLANLNTTSWPMRLNKSYLIRASLTGGPLNGVAQNFTASNVTVYVTVKDNQAPSISISKPAAGSAFTENSATFRFTVDDNAADAATCEYKLDSGSFKGASAGTDISISDLSTGDHTILARCDDASSIRTETTVKFSVNVLPSAPGPSSTSTPVVSTPSEDKGQVFIAKISANKQVVVSITKGDVSEITVSVKNDVTSIYININRLDVKPADLSDAPGKVFRYIDIKPSGLPESAIDKAKIKFKVDKSWITSNNADPTKIVLKRFANGIWNNLVTAKVSEDATSITYEAETPGFSTFAISFDEAAPAVTPAPGEAPITTTIPAPSVTSTTIPSAAPGVGGISPVIIGVVIVVIVAIAIYLVKTGVI